MELKNGWEVESGLENARLRPPTLASIISVARLIVSSELGNVSSYFMKVYEF